MKIIWTAVTPSSRNADYLNYSWTGLTVVDEFVVLAANVPSKKNDIISYGS